MIRPEVQAIIDGINGLEAKVAELSAVPADDGITQATVDEAVAAVTAEGVKKLAELEAAKEADFAENIQAIRDAFDASPVAPNADDLPPAEEAPVVEEPVIDPPADSPAA